MIRFTTRLAMLRKITARIVGCSLFFLAGPAFAQNLISNPGFENANTSGWQTWGNLFHTGSNKRSGWWAAQLDSNGGAGTFVNVTSGAQYDLSIWGTSAGRLGARVGYKFYDSSWQVISGDQYLDAFDTNWSLRSRSITAPGNAVHMLVMLWNGSDQPMYIDDVSLTTGSSSGQGGGTATTQSSGGNLLANSNFESGGLAPWQSWQNLQVAGWGARSGNYSLLAGNSGGGDTTVDVTAGATYTFSAWGRSERSGDAVIGYQLLNQSWQAVSSEVRASPFSTTYQQRSLSITVPGGASKIKLFVWNGSGSNLFLDDLSLTSGGGGSSATGSGSGTSSGGNAGSSGGVNSIDTIVSDMALLNDLPLIGVNPSYGFARGPGHNVMGNNASGSGVPSWYAASYPHLANNGYWKSMLPWFVMFHGQGNGATNTRVQMRNLKMFVLSRSTNQWRELTSAQDIGGEFCPQGSNYDGCTGGNDKRYESSGGVSIKPRWGQDYHGWYGGRQPINGWDIKAVFVTMQSRLVVDNTSLSDDRWRAKYLFDVGADYYPELGSSSVLLPGVGVSRAKLISNDWQAFNFMTFSDVGKQEPGGGISQSEFRNNPPPLQ